MKYSLVLVMLFAFACNFKSDNYIKRVDDDKQIKDSSLDSTSIDTVSDSNHGFIFEEDVENQNGTEGVWHDSN